MRGRLLLAFELFESGLDMMRQTLRRNHPDLDGVDLEHLLEEWLQFRPGAEQGDAEGRPVLWPPERR